MLFRSVSGLRLVSDLDNVLNATNHIREEFRNFSFPVILWIDDEILTKLIRSVPDFYSWATTVKFDKTSDELKIFIQQTADKVFNKLKEGYENELLDHKIWNQVLGSHIQQELLLAKTELQKRRVKIEPEIESEIGRAHV